MGINKAYTKIQGFLLILCMLFTTPVPAMGAAVTTAVTAATQKQLDKALISGGVSSVIIKTDKEIQFTIPNKKYSQITVVMAAPKATVINKGTFKEVVVEKGSDSITGWKEYGTGNTIRITASNASLYSAKNSSIESLAIEKKNSKIKFAINGTVKKITLNKKSKVTITGAGDNIPVFVCPGAKSSTVSANISLDLTVSANVAVSINEGAEASAIIKVNGQSTTATVTNNTKKEITIKTPNGTVTIGSGKKATITQSKAEPTVTPTAAPNVTPTAAPTAEPTATPNVTPTATPTAAPTPTAEPIIVGEQPAITSVTDTTSGFKHPSIGYTAETLTTAQKMVREGYEPWASAFDDLKTSAYSDLDYEIRNQDIFEPAKPAYTAINCDARAKECVVDASACWNQTLMWLFTGNNEYRENAMTIIRLWNQINPDEVTTFYDCQITMGNAITPMTKAAEILRYTTCTDETLNWTEEDTSNYINNFLSGFANSGFYLNHTRWMNQHGIAMCCYAAVSIFQDDTDGYNQMIEWTTVNKSATEANWGWSGAIDDQIRYVTVDDRTGEAVEPHIQLIECGRDQPHASGNISALSEIATVAAAQGTKVDNDSTSDSFGEVTTGENGVNLFEFLDDRILAGANYLDKYNLGYDCLYTSCNVGGSGDSTSYYDKLSDTNRGESMTCDLVYMYYKYNTDHDIYADDMKYVTQTIENAGGLSGSAVLLYGREDMKTGEPLGEPSVGDSVVYREKTSGFDRLQAFDFIGRSTNVSTSIFQDVDGNRSVLYDVRWDNAYTWYEMDFEAAADYLTARVATNSTGGEYIDVILLDDVAGIDKTDVTETDINNGEVIATLHTGNTGWWTNYNTVSGELSRELSAGTHLFAFKYYGSSNKLYFQIAFDWFCFSQHFAGAVNQAADADTLGEGASLVTETEGTMVKMENNSYISYNGMDFDSGNNTIEIYAKTTASDGCLKLMKEDQVIAVYNIAKNTGGELGRITCEIAASDGTVTGVNDISLVYEGSEPLILQSYKNIELDRSIAEEGGSTIREAEVKANVMGGSCEIITEDGITYVKTASGSAICLVGAELQSDRTVDCIVSFRVKSDSLAELNLCRDIDTEPFASIIIPDTQGEWTTVSCNIREDIVSTDVMPVDIALLYLRVNGLEGTNPAVLIDYMDTGAANSAPSFTDAGEDTEYVFYGENFRKKYAASDIDLDSIRYSLTNEPEGASMEESIFTWTVPAEISDFTVYISATDGTDTTTIKRNFKVFGTLGELIAELEKGYDTAGRYTTASDSAYQSAISGLKTLAQAAEKDDGAIILQIDAVKEAIANLHSLNQYIVLSYEDGTISCIDFANAAAITVTDCSSALADGLYRYQIITDGDFTNKKDFYLETGGKEGYMLFDLGEGIGAQLDHVYFHGKTGEESLLTGTFIEGSNDGYNWITLTQKAVNSKSWQELTMISPDNLTSCRYIRISNHDTAWWGVIGEVRFAGTLNEIQSVDAIESLTIQTSNDNPNIAAAGDTVTGTAITAASFEVTGMTMRINDTLCTAVKTGENRWEAVYTVPASAEPSAITITASCTVKDSGYDGTTIGKEVTVTTDSPAVRVQAAAAGITELSIAEDRIVLPVKTGMTFTLSDISDEDIISADGLITRKTGEDKTVSCTVTVSDGENTAKSAAISLFIESDLGIISQSITSLSIKNDEIVLPVVTGCAISIAASSDEEVIELNGTVHKGNKTVKVEIILRFEKEGYAVTGSAITVTVPIGDSAAVETVNCLCTADTYLETAKPSADYSKYTWMSSSDNGDVSATPVYRAYARFDLSGLDTYFADASSDSYIDSGQFTFYYNYNSKTSGSFTVRLFFITTDSWSEGTLVSILDAGITEREYLTEQIYVTKTNPSNTAISFSLTGEGIAKLAEAYGSPDKCITIGFEAIADSSNTSAQNGLHLQTKDFSGGTYAPSITMNIVTLND